MSSIFLRLHLAACNRNLNPKAQLAQRMEVGLRGCHEDGETLKGLKEALKSVSFCLLILDGVPIFLVVSRLTPHLPSPITDRPGSHEKKEKDVLALNPLCSRIQIQKKTKGLLSGWPDLCPTIIPGNGEPAKSAL